MNEQNKKLLECAEFIKECCENRDFCDGCAFHKEEIERDEYTNNQNARCVDCPAILTGNKENENNIFYPDDVKNCWIGRETLLKIKCEIEHLHEGAFNRDEILKIIDKYIFESEV